MGETAQALRKRPQIPTAWLLTGALTTGGRPHRLSSWCNGDFSPITRHFSEGIGGGWGCCPLPAR